MKVNGFFIVIENVAGTVLGSGPITEAAYWEYTMRLDRAGSFSFSIPATVEKAVILQNECIARAYALLGSTWTEVGAGPINHVERSKGADGRVSLVVSGDDLLRELTYRSVGDLELAATHSFIGHTAAVTAVAAFLPSGWTLTADGTPPNDDIYARFNGESVLAAVLKLAEASETHIYRGAGRNVTFAHTFTTSGLRAMRGGPGLLAAETCAITRLTERVETYEFYTRIIPVGSGNGAVELTLQNTDRTAPAGYTLSTSSNYLQNDTMISSYDIRERRVEFKEIAPIDNTAADWLAASNALFDAALRELQWASEGVWEATYDVELAGCSALLRPLQTIHIVYRDDDEGLDVDAALNILETTWRIEANEIQTTRLVVTSAERWARNDVDVIADSVTQGRVYQAHPQLNGNSYWENGTVYVGENQTTHMGEMPFIFGPEVAQLQQVVLRYKPVQVLAFSTAVAGASTSSGASSETTTLSDNANHGHDFTIADGTTGDPVFHNSGVGVLMSDGGGVIGVDTTDANHTHGMEHTHTFTPVVTTTFGIFKADSADTYVLGDLEYSINGTSPINGSWDNLNTGTATGDGYYEVDITTVVQDGDNFRPLQENNLIQIRRTTAAGTGKTTQIYLKLGVRDSIQSVTYE